MAPRVNYWTALPATQSRTMSKWQCANFKMGSSMNTTEVAVRMTLALGAMAMFSACAPIIPEGSRVLRPNDTAIMLGGFSPSDRRVIRIDTLDGRSVRGYRAGYVQAEPGQHLIGYECIIMGSAIDVSRVATVTLRAAYRYDIIPGPTCDSLTIYQRKRADFDDAKFQPDGAYIAKWTADRYEMYVPAQRAAQQQELARTAEVARLERDKVERSRKVLAGTRLCKGDRYGEQNISYLAFTEDYANGKIKLAVAGIDGLCRGGLCMTGTPRYNGVAMNQGAMIWDDPAQWQLCN